MLHLMSRDFKATLYTNIQFTPDKEHSVLPLQRKIN